MTTIFLTIALIALAVLVFSALLDGIFDAFNFEFMDGILGPISMSAFFVVFGFTGSWLSGNTDWATPIIIGVSVVAGACILIPVGFFTKFLEKSESGVVNNDTLVGTIGSVITDIKPGQLGQVRLNHSGHLATMAATASELIESPTSVKVVSVTPPSIIHVERLHPLKVETVDVETKNTPEGESGIDLEKN